MNTQMIDAAGQSPGRTAPEATHSPAAGRGDKTPLRILWRDHLRIGIAPSSIALAGYRCGMRAKLSHTAVTQFDPSGEDRPWKAAVDALPDLIGKAARRRPNATVVLSNRFVRYVLLPWNPAIKRNAEWLALARHRFSSVHGGAAESWVIRVSGTDSEGPRIASAIDSALLSALEQAIQPCATLISVQPYLITVYNRLQGFIGRESCWLVVEEPGRLTIALIEQGVWRAIRTRRKEQSSCMTLPEILDRESALLGLEQPCARVALCTHAAGGDGQRGPYEIFDLTFTGSAVPGERALAMAME